MENMKFQRRELSAYMEEQARLHGVEDGVWRRELLERLRHFHSMAAARQAVDEKIAELAGGVH
jgi:hypothetical protein